MKATAIARVVWAAGAAPLAVVVVFVTLIMWPGVFQNSLTTLSLFAYVVLVPMLPLIWRGRHLGLLVIVALGSVALQVAAFGFANHWFDGTWNGVGAG